MTCSSPTWLALSGKSGGCVLLDEADIGGVEDRRWYLSESFGNQYARDHSGRLMHRVILGLATGQLADHVNGSGLDNRRGNLRSCSVRENRQNSRNGRRAKRGLFKGVRDPNGTTHKRWRAKITANGREYHLGSFDSAEDAARAYDSAARKFFGEFAACNFPEVE